MPTENGQPLGDDELLSIVASRLSAAGNGDGSGASSERKDLLDYYKGEPYGNERVGFSSVVTREVMEAVEWAMPGIVRVFMSGDQVVSFSPVGPEDEEAAEQETDIVNHYIQTHQDWYEQSCAWIKAALLYPNAYLKVGM